MVPWRVSSCPVWYVAVNLISLCELAPHHLLSVGSYTVLILGGYVSLPGVYITRENRVTREQYIRPTLVLPHKWRSTWGEDALRRQADHVGMLILRGLQLAEEDWATIRTASGW